MQRDPNVPEREAFGGTLQHDVHEFAGFLLGYVDDETNMRRDHAQRAGKIYTTNDGTITENALDCLRRHHTYMDSIIDRYFRHLEVNIFTCRGCPEEQTFFDGWHSVLRVEEGDNGTVELAHLLARRHAREGPSICETCMATNRMRQLKYARIPDRLVFMISRFGAAGKLKTKVRFPTRNLDVTKYCAGPDPGPMIYDCYAVVIHVGDTLSSGHYYAYVQDEQSRDPTDWWNCNDHICTRVKIDSQNPTPETEKMYKDGTAHPYLLFYRRQGT